jgi:hypothetical protein
MIILILLLAACGAAHGQGIASRGVQPQARPKASGLPWHARFTNVAQAAGLTQVLHYGGTDRSDYVLETSSGGVALFDYDNDGLLDIFLVVGSKIDNPPPDAVSRLYRNLGGLKFEDVTRKAGLWRAPGWAQGASIGDYNNDGCMDLFVTYWGQNVLYRNNCDGTFADVTQAAGLVETPQPKIPRWGAGATFLDYDRDGFLDLYVSNYIDFDLTNTPKPGQNPNCNWKGVPVSCGPRGLKTARHWLYHNRGDGTFEDVSVKAGIARYDKSFGMTAVAFDFDEDGWTDIYNACDSTPSLLFRNRHDGAFTEEGMERGIALNDDGMEQAGMGLGIGDVNLDGRLDLFKTHFADDTHVLYINDGQGMFHDITLKSGLGVDTHRVGWGTGIYDFDHDGLPDIFIGTGCVYPETEAALPAYPYRSRPMLFRNLGAARFELIEDEAGPAMLERHSVRGVAFGDLDNDGDIDIVLWNRNETPSLLRNDLDAPGRHWLQIRLEGARSNRGAFGARVVVQYGGRKQAKAVLSQASFYSANDPRLHFGLGAASSARVTVYWPNGRSEQFPELKADTLVTLKEGTGQPLRP